MKKILVIDNYDSFTYNLVHCIEKLTGSRPDVFRNDEIAIEDIKDYDKILLSPGPGIPEEAGICIDAIRTWAAEKSILGVCLGHQAIGMAFGGSLINLVNVYHGLATPVNIIEKRDPLFRDLPESILAGRYHSWVVAREGIPECLNITCIDENNFIMGISHRTYDVRGVQFHPESVLTENGLQIINNWLLI
jgi:anthranilate synthase component 2